MKRRLRNAVHVAVLAALVSSTQVARAQSSAPGTNVSPAQMAEAKSYFDAGAKAFDAGDFETAIQAFSQAYKVVPRDNLVFSIAQAHRRQYVATGDYGHARAAIDHYRRYVTAVTTGGRRSEAVKALEELEAAVRSAPAPAQGTHAEDAEVDAERTRIFINSRTPDAVFTVDDGPEQPVARSVEVTPGSHRVRVTAPGHLPDELTVVAREGELVPQSVDLRARPALLTIRADAGAAVFVDGRFVGEAPLPDALSLAPGRHYVSLALRGHQSRATELRVAAGEKKDLVADLPTTQQRDVAYGFLATSGAFVAASGVFILVSASRHRDAEKIYNEHLTDNVSRADVVSYEHIVAQRDRFAIAGGSTAILGVIVGLVGTGLYVFDDAAPLSVPAGLDDEGGRPAAPTSTFEIAAVPSMGADGGGAMILGRF